MLGVAAGCVLSLAVLPYVFYEYATREMWRRPYLNWTPMPWASDSANDQLGEINAIGAKRRWTEADAERLHEILSIDLGRFDDTHAQHEISDRYAMARVLGDAILVISDRLVHGPLDDDALRSRLEGMLLAALDHEYLEIRSAAVGAAVEARLARRPEVHARLLVLQHSDPSDRVRNVARIHLEHDAITQDLENKGKIYVPPEWMRRR
ncbi:MAG: hypothetical protein EA379_08400 [Phycisphaerales bacterium]|nr:MAG: hypothetical protein EA379_08400 [Phycisphaerales bacterium]